MDHQAIYKRRWVILSVLVIGLLATVIDNTVLNVALKTIAKPVPAGLGASQSSEEWTVNSYTLVFAGLLFSFGVIGDRIGRKRMLIAGLVVFGIGSLLSAYSHAPTELIGARAVMGMGGAAIMPQTLSIISNVFEPKERPKAIGIWATAVGVGIASGPVLGGLLLTHFWWGSVFLINVPVTLVGVLAVVALVPESRNPDPGKIDYIGVLASIAGLTLLVFGIVRGGDTSSWTRLDVLGTIAGGLIVLALFAWYESRIRHPSLDVRLFRDRRLSASVGALMLQFLAWPGVFFFTSYYLQNVRGYSPLGAGAVSVTFAAGQMLMSPRSAGLVRRYGAKAVGAAGLLIMAVALGGYALLSRTSPIAVLVVLYFIQGAGVGTATPAAASAVMAVLPRERAGVGAALTNTSRQVAIALSVAALGSILAESYRSSMSPKLALLPAALRSTAAGSITATQGIAGRFGAAGRALLAPADTAYVDAMHIATLTATGIAVLGALVVLRWMPGKPEAGAVIAKAAADARLAADAS